MSINRQNPNTPLSDRIAATEKLYNEAELGVSADAVLRALDPMIERRLGLLLDQFAVCAPELGALLDLRGKISELWRMRKEMLQAREKGRRSFDVIQSVLLEKGYEKGGMSNGSATAREG